MLSTLKSLLDTCFPEEQKAEDPHAKNHLAAAALMVEIATIDEHFEEREMAALAIELERQFQLPKAGIEKLISAAKQRSHHSTSLYEFTQTINSDFSNTEKFELLVGMWRIAFADGHLDKYEEYMVRKVSELIYMAHGDFIRAKHTAKEAQS